MGQHMPKAAIKGTANGVLFMAFFGLAWAGVGIDGLDGWGNPWLPIIFVCIGVFIFMLGLSLLRAAKKLPNHTRQKYIQRGKRVGIGFGVTFAAEFILIGAAGGILGAMDQFEYFPPVMALIVGVHFFPLAYLFQVNIHYVAGTLLCLFAVIALFWLPPRFVVNHLDIDVWSVFVGFSSATTLWTTGMVIWKMGRRMIRGGH